VHAIGTISDTIGQINEISAAIASAAEQQNAVARVISSNMQSAAEAVGSISQNVTQIAEATKGCRSLDPRSQGRITGSRRLAGASSHQRVSQAARE
jgi:methyl-accepting chemotaxis protein